MTPWGKAYDAKMREHLQLLLWWRRTPQRNLAEVLGGVDPCQVTRRLDGFTVSKAWELAALLEAMGVDPEEFHAGVLGGLHAEVYLARIGKGKSRQKYYAGSDLMAEWPSRAYTAEELRDLADGLQDLRIVDPEAARSQALEVIRCAHHYGLDPGVGSRFKADLALGAVYRARGGYGTAATFLLKALDLAGTDERLRARLHHAMVPFASDMGNFEVGLQAADAAFASYRRLGDRLSPGRVLVSKGNLLGQAGHLDEAIDAFCRGLGLITEDRWYWRVSCFQGLGICYMLKEEPSSALRYADESVAALDSQSDTVPPLHEAAARWLRGEILLRMGSSEGIPELRAALEIRSKENGDKLNFVLNALRLACAYHDHGQFEEQEALTTSLMRILREMGPRDKVLHGAYAELNSSMVRGKISREALRRASQALRKAGGEKGSSAASLRLG